MLAEWFTQLTTPCQKPYRQLGYLSELIAIKHRHARCKEAWQPHLQACKKLIAEASQKTPNTYTAVVLGSGQLLDIPIDVLAKRFDSVYLVDICHLRNSRKIAKTYPNIKFIEADISGTVAPLLDWVPGQDLPVPNPDLRLLAEADYVISSNLLAQLPLAPLQYLRQKEPDMDELQQNSYAKLIISQHLEMLKSLGCPVTLISEISHIISNGTQILEETDPLQGLKLPEQREEWEWDLAPRPELNPDFDLKLRVAGIADLNVDNQPRT